MTESDQAGQGGRARRGVGRPAATETAERLEQNGKAPVEGSNGSGSTSSTAEAASSPTPSKAEDSARTATRSSGASTAALPKSERRADPAGKSTSVRASATGARPAGRGPSSARKPRRARLRLTQVDAWTVMKTSFLLSIALGIVSVVAVAIIWLVLGAAGVFDSMNDTVQTLLGNDFRVQDYIGTGRILGFTMILAVVDVVLLTAIATLAAFLYNLAATLLGGVEVTLTEDS